MLVFSSSWQSRTTTLMSSKNCSRSTLLPISVFSRMPLLFSQVARIVMGYLPYSGNDPPICIIPVARVVQIRKRLFRAYLDDLKAANCKLANQDQIRTLVE